MDGKERTQEEWKLLLPQEFWMPAASRPKCFTVGELKEQLARLPDDLPVSVVGGAGLAMYIYSVDTFDEEDCAPELVFEDSYDPQDDEDDISNFWDADDEDWMEVNDEGEMYSDDDDDDDDEEESWDEDWDDDED